MINPLSGIFSSLGRTVLVTGTDTDVGKTYATAALAVAGWYAHLGEALAGSAPPPAATDRDGPAEERLVEAVRRDLEDRSGLASPTAVRMIWTGDHLDALRRLQPALRRPAADLASTGRAAT